ncbi:MAG: histidine phosphatase family protein [Candidatus Omnitrophota bacterium]|nr:histidine phosphatase family protein [Candidatus Omnitrophota bacterium]
MTRLILIRHGVTRWNKQKRYCGHKDIGLSNEGKSQVKLLSKGLDIDRFDKIYCSNQKRATQTARILFKERKIIIDRGLREINFGVLEGLRHQDIMERYTIIYKKWIKNSFKNRIPNAEPMGVFKKRVGNALRKIVKSNPDKTIAVVCHGGVIGIFVNGISRSGNFWSCVPSPASVTMVEHKRGKLRLIKFNDIGHLRGSDE